MFALYQRSCIYRRHRVIQPRSTGLEEMKTVYSKGYARQFIESYRYTEEACALVGTVDSRNDGIFRVTQFLFVDAVCF